MSHSDDVDPDHLDELRVLLIEGELNASREAALQRNDLCEVGVLDNALSECDRWLVAHGHRPPRGQRSLVINPDSPPVQRIH